MEEIKICPVCTEGHIEPFITCEDFTVSHERFSIKTCKNCGFKFTSPRPNSQEIGRYYESPDYISHSNTSDGLINKIYHFVKKRAINRKIKIIESLRPYSKEILDIGCGTGAFLKGIKDTGWKAIGVEPNGKAREYCLKQELEVYPEDYLRTTPDKFAVVTMWHVLEHVHELNERIEEIRNLLIEGGYAFIAVPNYKSSDAKKYGEYWAAYDVPRHLYHFSEDTMKALFKKHQFKFIKSLPMKMDSFYVSMLSEKYRKSSFQYLKAFFAGFKSNKAAGNNPEKFSSVIYVFSK
jgi:2-polyprenyl-3-methyl-5-hydroxy-6-metoxy-1,4-benzoquinol methylase